ncbi:TRAP transporter small permease [Devosia sp. RR2S18]|uniref:TRAP transporter small permease n=1 Tax=Devosia rhizosphaerae TaxID=3049774 RepID=UPI002540A374|nr:TRAP transporter small permease [Devosia sp. RR2S18]WIJ25077.1 TRAP transporter small permease [Devosia sp. RR2S18]
MTNWLERGVTALAAATAITGGVVMIASILLVVISVAGRALLWAGLGPIPGDYELVSAAMGLSVFAFLPWAHLTRGHAIVTLLTDNFGRRFNAWLLVITDLLMFIAALFIAWRLYYGMMDKFAFRETTLLLRMPLGWAYAAALVGAAVFVVVSLFVVGRSIRNAATGQTEPVRAGADL